MAVVSRCLRGGRAAAALALFAIVGSGAACRGPSASPGEEASGDGEPGGDELVPGQVLLRMAPDSGPDDLDRVLRRIDGRVLRSLDLVPGLHQVLTPLSPDEARRRLAGDGDVLSVRPNRTVRPAESP